MYRKELTVIGGLMGEAKGECMYDDYYKAVQTLTDEAFFGNYLIALFQGSTTFDVILDLCDPKSSFTFDDYIKNVLPSYLKEFRKKMEEA
jgi:hypothetical protein